MRRTKSFFLILSFSSVILSAALSQAQMAADSWGDHKAIPVNNDTIRKALRSSAIDFKKIIEVIPGTTSQELSWLESATSRRDSFLTQSAEQAQLQFSKNSEYEKIKTFLLEALSKKADEEFSAKISDTRKIVVANDQLVRTAYDIDGENKAAFFSTNDFSPKKAAVLGLYPSPQKDYVATLISLDGNIDNSQLLVYSLQDKKIVLNTEITNWLEDLLWLSDSQVMYTHPLSNSHGSTLILHDLKTGQKRQLINYGIVSFKDWVGYTDYTSDDLFLKNLKTGQQLNYNNLSVTDITEEDSEFFYLKSNGSPTYNGQVLKLAKVNFATPTALLEKMKGFYLASFAFLKTRQILATYSRDSLVTVVIYSAKGEKLYQTTLPDGLRFSSLEATEEADVYKMSVQTVFATGNVIWKVKESTPDFSEVLKDAFKSKDLEIVSRVEYFKSADGEFIPARITHKKDLLINGNHPVFMEAYGGFNLMGYLSPSFSKIKQEFVKRGGILVGTGVRGGAERGFEWYKTGSAFTEMNTTLDVIAIADGLVKNGYTTSKKIVLTGASNGGYVVANAALTSPQSFGLVIPINGVQDQLDFPTMDRWGLGWQDEYLNPYDPKEFKLIYPRAPLEIIPKSADQPFMLVVNGEHDSRVNKVHSYKLKAHLDEIWPNRSILYSVKNAGHWPTSSYLLDDIGIEANAKVWAEIFTHTGLQF